MARIAPVAFRGSSGSHCWSVRGRARTSGASFWPSEIAKRDCGIRCSGLRGRYRGCVLPRPGSHFRNSGARPDSHPRLRPIRGPGSGAGDHPPEGCTLRVPFGLAVRVLQATTRDLNKRGLLRVAPQIIFNTTHRREPRKIQSWHGRSTLTNGCGRRLENCKLADAEGSPSETTPGQYPIGGYGNRPELRSP